MIELRDIELDRLVCGGFVVARPIKDFHDGYLALHGVTRPVISASPCICDALPETWMFSYSPEWSFEERVDAAADWGIPADKVTDLVAWVNEREAQGRMAFPLHFLDVETAQAFVRGFLPATSEGRVLGMAFARGAVRAFRDRMIEVQSAQELIGGRCPTSDLLLREVRVPPGGRALGYEVLGMSPWGERHSWRCHGIAREMHEQFGVLPASNGLFLRPEDAERVAAWCDDPASGTEPVAWAAWLLVQYGSERPKA